ncbi:MAG: aspartate aminotransferase family protein [Dehalococcoidia bacterium]|mgnify:CR=1 FL=1
MVGNVDWQAIESKYYIQTVNRVPITIVRGKESTVWDDKGRSYLDFVGGWATATLGHSHPTMIDAIVEQSKLLIQVSNAFYTIPQIELAQLLIDNSCMDRVFFCNSGAEAVEGAIKVARRYGKLNKNGASEIITALNSFHGRTLGTVAATGQPDYQENFKPLLPGFVHVSYNDFEQIKKATTDKTVAILLEPVQGEGGVNVPDQEYFRNIRAWCDENNLLLILDEVQTGVGRLGKLFGYQMFDIEPDVMTLAKGLGGGVPIGAFMVKERANSLTFGDHGSTFGGNALTTAAARSVVEFVINQNLPETVRLSGQRLKSKLLGIAESESSNITEIRGEGLLIAIQFKTEIGLEVMQECLSRGLLINRVRPDTVRLMPPLIVSDEDIDKGIEIISEAIQAVSIKQ